jgi:hypothetical protein
MTDAIAGDDDDDVEERSLLDALSADSQGQTPPPPTASPGQLPSDLLAPPMFERLVAEVALRVDGLSRIRIYGRSGQDQGGLDLIGWDSDGLTVYQVRRVNSLSAGDLRTAVEDFAKPTVKKTGAEKPRRFNARRFVLVTGCVVDDRHVDDELTKLKDEYRGDFEIDLYDNTELSFRLRDRGPLVYGIFGPDWARAYCGYQPPAEQPVPHGRAYLGDPIDILGYSSVRGQAEQLAEPEPAAAAALYEDLADRLDAAGFRPRSREIRWSQLAAHRKAGQTPQAVEVAVNLALAEYDEGDLFPRSRPITTVAELVGSSENPLPRVLEALANWFERGYDLAPVTNDLAELSNSDAPGAIALLIAVAEQVIADDDPRDDARQLLKLIEQRLPHARGLAYVRLACAAADLHVRFGADPGSAFRELTRLALGGHVDASQAAFIHRRRGRALAAVDLDEAIESYRRAVLDASERGFGGDVRDALRSIAFLNDPPDGVQPMDAARSVTDRKRLLDGVDRVVVSALEALADDKLPQALRDCHDWIRRERINGALMDEIVALRRYGNVYARAGEHTHAARALVRGGARKAAKQAASDAGRSYVDVSSYLEPRHLTSVHDAAVSCLARQADYVPDDDVEPLCSRLLELAEGIGTEQLFRSQASISALEALAAFGKRLPEAVADQLLVKLAPLVERKPGTYRYCDEAMLALFVTCALHDAESLAERGVTELVRCIDQNIDKAERHIRRVGRSDRAIELLRPLAATSNRLAIELLATWGVVTKAVRTDALDAAQRLLARPVGQPRSVWAAGQGVQESVIKFRAVLADSPPAGDVAAIRDQLIEHLLRWAEDSYDVADSRSDAVHAIRILADMLPEDARRDAFTRLIALHDEPQLSQLDQFNQESLHPLSRFRINTGSDILYSDCLFAAAVLAKGVEEWQQTWQRITVDLSSPSVTPAAAANIGRAARSINNIKQVDIRPLATHDIAMLRQVAVICWAEDSDRDPTWAAVFAADEDMVVRANLAHGLQKLSGYEAVLAQLKLDDSWNVRTMAHG